MHLDERKLIDIYKSKKTDRDIFQELMPLKVREVLIVSSIYDAYSVQREGQFSDDIVGEYLQLRIYSSPRFKNASNLRETQEKLSNNQFDLIIVMAGLDKRMTLSICQLVKKMRPKIPVLLMLNNNAFVQIYDEILNSKKRPFENAFIWNGNTNVFFAMIKYIEDKHNADNDTSLGDVRVILLVEDSIRYCSLYLPLLYSVIIRQTQRVIDDQDSRQEIHTSLKMRARPKVLLAKDYEQAIELIKKYQDNLLCVISDNKFPKNNVVDDFAGTKLINYINKNCHRRVKTLLQSTEDIDKETISKLHTRFLNKNSETLIHQLENFFFRHLGFGDFIFRDETGKEIDTAETFAEFEEKIKTIPDGSILYHAQRHSFATWMMARGEISLSKKLRSYTVDDFSDLSQIRKICLTALEDSRKDKVKGKIVPFDKEISSYNNHIVRLSKGSLGGKGRGLAFLSNIIENTNFEEVIKDFAIKVPPTAVIGTNSYEEFFEDNKISEKISKIKELDDTKILQFFLKCKLPKSLRSKISEFLEIHTKPLAIRSSGLLEDSPTNPFSGLYNTFFVPNNNPDFNMRLNHVLQAIKAVYASMFLEKSRKYFAAVGLKEEEEKMAVVVQELVGNPYQNRFYPHISGIAQSYNYYPFSYIKPEDGLVVMAVGMGAYVVSGEKTYRFCPRYPKLDIKEMSDVIRDSQTHFLALNLENQELDFTQDPDSFFDRLAIRKAEEDGNIQHLASVYDADNDILTVDFEKRGKRVINFQNILKYNYLNLSDTINKILSLFQQALAYPVEIEFSIDLNTEKYGKPSLNILQLKPFARNEITQELKVDFNIDNDKIFTCEKFVGNGKVENLTDIVLVKPDTFNKLKTPEIAKEIAAINTELHNSNTDYILIGPGRWGTRDPYIGIPVEWSYISKAKIIVEYGLESLPLDGSLGSHFFHNVVMLNVVYCSIKNPFSKNAINFDFMKNKTIVKESEFILHIRFDKPLKAYFDAKQSKGIVFISEEL